MEPEPKPQQIDPDNKLSTGLTLVLSEQMIKEKLAQGMWMIFFGEFETEVSGLFQIEVSPDGTKVQIDHPDPDVLLRFTESFYERRYKTWSEDRLKKAVLAAFIKIYLL